MLLSILCDSCLFGPCHFVSLGNAVPGEPRGFAQLRRIVAKPDELINDDRFRATCVPIFCIWFEQQLCSLVEMLLCTDASLLPHPHLQEGELEDMKVGWSLKGLLLHNLTVALCVAPILHQDISMTQRCECAISGFCLLDLWKVLADQSLGTA